MINIEMVKRKYSHHAYYYDFVTQVFSRIRAQAISQLKLTPGNVVLDFGCGTGLSFDLIEHYVGPEGKIIGIELSPSMLAKARQKISSQNWGNIDLLESNAEEVILEPNSVDAVLSFYTHDIMSSPQAVERAVRALRPGGIFVAAGTKLVSGSFRWLLNPVTLAYANRAITIPLTEHPWRQLEKLMGPIEVQDQLMGTSYIASGIKETEK